MLLFRSVFAIKKKLLRAGVRALRAVVAQLLEATTHTTISSTLALICAMGASAVPGVRRSARLMQELPVAKRERPVAKGERPVAKRKKRMEVPDTKREKAKAFATAAHASTAREASARADGVELIVGYATTPVPQTLRIASIATLPAALAPDRATPRPQPAGATRRGGVLLPGRSSPRPAPFRREPNRFRASATRRASPTRFRAPSSGNISRLGHGAGSRELRWQLSCSGRGGASPTLTPAFLSLTRESSPAGGARGAVRADRRGARRGVVRARRERGPRRRGQHPHGIARGHEAEHRGRARREPAPAGDGPGVDRRPVLALEGGRKVRRLPAATAAVRNGASSGADQGRRRQGVLHCSGVDPRKGDSRPTHAKVCRRHCGLAGRMLDLPSSSPPLVSLGHPRGPRALSPAQVRRAVARVRPRGAQGLPHRQALRTRLESRASSEALPGRDVPHDADSPPPGRHVAAIAKHGATAIHRRTFAPLKAQELPPPSADELRQIEAIEAAAQAKEGTP